MIIYHHTDLDSAIKIRESKRFIPHHDPFFLSNHGDYGMNSFPTLNGDYMYDQKFENEGVIMIFKWEGAIEYTQRDTPMKYLKRDTLHIQKPWRSFIPAPYYDSKLKLISIRCSDNVLKNNIATPFYFRILPTSLQQRLYRKYKLHYIKSVKEFFSRTNIFINIY